MIQIVGELKYDTDKALPITTIESKRSKLDAHYWAETLYRTKRGNWFIHGRGGPGTQYCTRLDETTMAGGERIVPVPPGDALLWLSNARHSELVDQYFGEHIQEA